MATKCHGYKSPFVHHTAVGWALVGSIRPDVSMDQVHTTLRTEVYHEHLESTINFPANLAKIHGIDSVFKERSDDELEGFSKEDERFLSILQNGIHINEKGNITMPLPFKKDEPSLSNNKIAVFHRTKNTLNRAVSYTHLTLPTNREV